MVAARASPAPTLHPKPRRLRIPTEAVGRSGPTCKGGEAKGDAVHTYTHDCELHQRRIANFIRSVDGLTKPIHSQSVQGPTLFFLPPSSAYLRITFDVPAAHVQLREHV